MPLNVPRPIMYEHQDFPEWVTPPGKDAAPMLANDEDEKRRILAGERIPQPEPPSAAPRVFDAPPLPYTKQDYPKWVTPPGKPDIIVNSLAEEQEALGLSQKSDVSRDASSDDVPSLIERQQAEEKAMLYRLAEEKDIKVDRRWGLDKLRDIVMGAAE